LKGLREWLLVVEKSKGLILVKDEVPDSSSAVGDRWCIMSLAMRVGGLEVVETNFLFLIFNQILNNIIKKNFGHN
jgi:hypothetical protein